MTSRTAGRPRPMGMSKITCDMAVSLDGFAAGLNQSRENPFGEGVGDLMLEPLEAWGTGLVTHLRYRVGR
jgi:hypothetical protein